MLRTVELRNGYTEPRKCVCNGKGVSTDYGCATYYHYTRYPANLFHTATDEQRAQLAGLSVEATPLTRVTEQVDGVGDLS